MRHQRYTAIIGRRFQIEIGAAEEMVVTDESDQGRDRRPEGSADQHRCRIDEQQHISRDDGDRPNQSTTFIGTRRRGIFVKDISLWGSLWLSECVTWT